MPAVCHQCNRCDDPACCRTPCHHLQERFDPGAAAKGAMAAFAISILMWVAFIALISIIAHR